MKQDFHGASIHEFRRRNETTAGACIDMRCAADRRNLAPGKQEKSMKTVITGIFTAAKQSTRAIDQLLRSCVRCDHVRTFLVKPSQKRAAYPTGGSRKKSSRASNQDDYWAIQDTAAGAIGLEVKPAAVAGGVGVNAYMGSLGGGLGKIGDDDRRTPSRPAGIVVAVETSDHVSQVLAVTVLSQHGARVIERGAGPWHDGNWPGFNPVPLGAERRSSARWVARAIAAAKRRELRRLKAAPYGKQEQRYGNH